MRRRVGYAAVLERPLHSRHATVGPRPPVMDVSVEVGSKRVFASAIDWPGYSRAARDQAVALETLVAYGPRYARVVARLRLGFRPPDGVDDLVVARRAKGTSGTDFGVPSVALPEDAGPIDEAELKRLVSLVRACWRAFDAAADGAAGKTLVTGPRGGGRSLASIRGHVREAEGAYVGALGRKAPRNADVQEMRDAVIDALTSAVRNGVEERGPRGGRRWVPRHFVRRLTWHTLDHAWELEDRTP